MGLEPLQGQVGAEDQVAVSFHALILLFSVAGRYVEVNRSSGRLASL